MAPIPAIFVACAAALATSVSGGPVSLTVNGAPAVLGTFAFPSAAKDVVFDNGLIRFVFGPIVNTEYSYTTISATDVLVGGLSIAHNISGESTDPEADQSFYM